MSVKLQNTTPPNAITKTGVFLMRKKIRILKKFLKRPTLIFGRQKDMRRGEIMGNKDKVKLSKN
ncbi:MAG: hypothetical protein RSC48_06590, partial [Anaerorhabdus sp.]